MEDGMENRMDDFKSAEQIAKKEGLDKAVVNYLLGLHRVAPIGHRMVFGYEVTVYSYKDYKDIVAKREAMLAEL
jgi:hypothetical protein